MKQRGFLSILAIGFVLIWSASMLSSCERLIQRVTEKVISNVMSFDYEDSDEWGKVVERNVDVPAFTKIDASGAVKILFSQDSVCSVRVRSNEKCIGKYEIEVRRNELKVKLKDAKKAIDKKSPSIILFVTAPLLEEIEFSGGCELEMMGAIDMPVDLEIKGNGVAKVRMDKVSVRNLDMKLSGAADFSAEQITAEGDIDLEVNGAGQSDLNAFCHELRVELNGAGSATVRGECQHFKCQENGASKVDFSNLKR